MVLPAYRGRRCKDDVERIKVLGLDDNQLQGSCDLGMHYSDPGNFYCHKNVPNFREVSIFY